MKQDKDGLTEDTTWLQWFSDNFGPSYVPKKEDSEYFKCKILCGIADALENIVLELRKNGKNKSKT